jgi:tRNA-Thr(GGU) m(6)t(6)A37 methyltransferase TsaA
METAQDNASSGKTDPATIRPIGIVHQSGDYGNCITEPGEQACIEVFPEFAPGLLGIEANTHIVVMGWLHEAKRDRLQVMRPNYDPDGDERVLRGVFACRSPMRPNPISITVARLLRVEGNRVYVDWVDLLDGTLVVDIKPHATGFEGVFSARSAREVSPLAVQDEARLQRGMVREAENFHGERCRGLALGVRVTIEAMRRLGVGQKDPDLTVEVGRDGCIADTLQALSGATFGNGRLSVSADGAFRLRHRGRTLTFLPPEIDVGFKEALEADVVAALRLTE